MSPKASSDFGLYKEKQKENHLKSLKFVLVIIISVTVFLTIVYAILHLVTNGSDSENFESSLEKPSASAEKLISAESRKREVFQSRPAKPFGITYKGLPPAEFMGSTTTEKITTLNYPQLLNHRHRHYPKNIQDVIGYRRRRPLETKNYKHYIPLNQAKNFSDNDPFYLFKPQDPGDINLLATASVRFAPPIWKNTAKNYPQQTYHQDNTNRQEVYNPKPLTVTLNIYPDDLKDPNENRQGLKHFITQRLENLPPRFRFPVDKAKKMVIHLNLYPDMLGGESKNYKNVVNVPINN